MAGLDQLQTPENYQAMMPEGAKWSMLGLNSIYDYNQQQDLTKARQNVLQNQGNELAQTGLQAAVANAQNTPANLQTLVAGNLGEAQQQQAAGAVAQAQLPVKQVQAQTDFDLAKIKKITTDLEGYQSELIRNPDAKPDDPAMQNVVSSYAAANKLPPLLAVNKMLENTYAVENKKKAAEAMASNAANIAIEDKKAATSRANTQDIVKERGYAADTRAGAMTNVATIRAQAQQIAKTNPGALAAHHAAQLNQLNISANAAQAKIDKIAMFDPDNAALLKTSLEAKIASQKAEIEGVYSSLGTSPVTPTQQVAKPNDPLGIR